MSLQAPDTRSVSQPVESRDRRWSRITGVQILGTGSYLPSDVITNAHLASLGCDEAWIVQRTGIRERRRAAAHEATSDLAYQAALRSLEAARVEPHELDLILVATMTPDHFTPATACLLQDRLGARCGALDLNAACSGFMYGLATAGAFIKSGSARKILVVGAEVMTRTVDPSDVKTVPLFGDGAGAAVVGAGSEEQGLLTYMLGSDGSGACHLNIPGGGSREPYSAEMIANRRNFMYMDGKPVFKWAVRTVEESLLGAMEQAGVTSDQIAAVVLHQANARILDAAVSDLGFAREKVLMNLDRYGNTSAASVPLVLDEAVREGKIQRGDLVLVCGFGAGLTWGVALMRW